MPAWDSRTNAGRTAIKKNSGAVVGSRPNLNFIEGSNITLTIADDAPNGEIDITIASTATIGGTDVTAGPVRIASGVSSFGAAASSYYINADTSPASSHVLRLESAANLGVVQTRLVGDANNRVNITTGGRIQLGAGIAAPSRVFEGSRTNWQVDVQASLKWSYASSTTTNPPLDLTASQHGNTTPAIEFKNLGNIAWTDYTERTVTDAAITNTSTTLTSATAAFTSSDVGRQIIGPAGVVPGTTISSVTNATTVEMSVAATATASSQTVRIPGARVNTIRSLNAPGSRLATASPQILFKHGTATPQRVDYDGSTYTVSPTGFLTNDNPDVSGGVYSVPRGADFIFEKAVPADDKPLVQIIRRMNVLKSQFTTDLAVDAARTLANEGNTALMVKAFTGASDTTDMQVNGIFSLASANNSAAWDAVGVWGLGQISTSGPSGRLGTGAYFEGRSLRTGGGGRVVGVEIRSGNFHDGNYAADGLSTSSGVAPFTGLWITCASGAAANSVHGDAIGIATAIVGDSWNTGISFKADSVTTNTIRDDSNSTTSIVINGTHSSYGIDFNAGTFSSGTIRLGNAQRLMARNATGSADVEILRFNASNKLQLGAYGTTLNTVIPNNSSIQARNNANSGDITLIRLSTSDVIELSQSGVGISIPGGSNIVFGTGTGTKLGTASNQLIGFWGATPVDRPGGWTTPTSTPLRTVADYNAASTQDIAATLAALVTDLLSMGLIG